MCQVVQVQLGLLSSKAPQSTLYELTASDLSSLPSTALETLQAYGLSSLVDVVHFLLMTGLQVFGTGGEYISFHGGFPLLLVKGVIGQAVPQCASLHKVFTLLTHVLGYLAAFLGEKGSKVS